MKRLLLVVMLIIMLLTMCSCSEDPNGINVYSTNGKMSEWISPDGVHYWFYKSNKAIGIAPRFDRDGHIIIDTHSEFKITPMSEK